MGRRGCRRRFILAVVPTSSGGLQIEWHANGRWDCGAEKVVANETAVDVEVLADHTADVVEMVLVVV